MLEALKPWLVASAAACMSALTLAIAIAFLNMSRDHNASDVSPPLSAVMTGICDTTDPLRANQCLGEILNRQIDAQQNRELFSANLSSASFNGWSLIASVVSLVVSFASFVATLANIKIAMKAFDHTVQTDVALIAKADESDRRAMVAGNARWIHDYVRVVAMGGGLVASYSFTNVGGSEARNLEVRLNSFVAPKRQDVVPTQYSRYAFPHSDIPAGQKAMLPPSPNRFLGDIPDAGAEGRVGLEILMHFKFTHRSIHEKEVVDEMFLYADIWVSGAEQNPEVSLLRVQDGPARVKALMQRGGVLDVTVGLPERQWVVPMKQLI
jgi:hypothetical protein